MLSTNRTDSKSSKSESESSISIIPNDYAIYASSIRLPFLAAGLVNSAVASLLTQLSSEFFKMAIINPEITSTNKPKEKQTNIQEEQTNTELQNANSSSNPVQNERSISESIIHTPENFPSNSDNIDDVNDTQNETVLQNTNEQYSFPIHPIYNTSTENSNFSHELVKIKSESDIGFPTSLTLGPNYSNFTESEFCTNQTPSNSNFINTDNNANETGCHSSHLVTMDYLKRYTCSYPGCEKIFFSKTSLLSHNQTHAIEKPYTCSYPGCEMTFSTESLLRTHNQLHEPRHTRTRFSCPLTGCNKVFMNRESLIEHIRIHTGERPFVCDYPGCTHRFARRCNLFAHKRVHLDKNQRRQYHCIHQGCGKTFLYPRSLTEHMNVHLGERPYVCDYPGCDKSFTSKSYLYAHRRIHLGVDKSPNSSHRAEDTLNMAHIPVTVTVPIHPSLQFPFSSTLPPPPPLSSSSSSLSTSHQYYSNQLH